MLNSQFRKIKSIVRATFVMAIILVLPSQAASPGNSFTCSLPNRICSCDVNTVGDCDGMKKNCKDGSIGWCNEINGKNICFCSMARSSLGKNKLKSLENVPKATVQ